MQWSQLPRSAFGNVHVTCTWKGLFTYKCSMQNWETLPAGQKAQTVASSKVSFNREPYPACMHAHQEGRVYKLRRLEYIHTYSLRRSSHSHRSPASPWPPKIPPEAHAYACMHVPTKEGVHGRPLDYIPCMSSPHPA